MRTFTKSLLTATFIGGVALAMPKASQAQLSQVMFTQNGGPVFVVNDNDPLLDSNNAPNIITINVNSAAFAAAFPTVDPGATVLSFTTSFPSVTSPYTLAQTARVGLRPGAADNTFTFTGSQTGFVGPNSSPYFETSSAAFTWNTQPIAEQSHFIAFVGTNNALYGNTNSDILLTGANNRTGNGAAADVGNGFSFSAGTYSFTSISTLDVTNSQGSNGFVQVIGNASITGTVVPEPSSIAMLIGMGVSGSAFVLRRRRAAK